jgi:hypothetical protein
MPKLNLDPITAQDLAEYLADTSDFAFELRTLRMLRAQGLVCDHGGLYEDQQFVRERVSPVPNRVPNLGFLRGG